MRAPEMHTTGQITTQIDANKFNSVVAKNSNPNRNNIEHTVHPWIDWSSAVRISKRFAANANNYHLNQMGEKRSKG